MYAFIDTETLGFTSPLLTLQWSNDFDKPVMWNIWAHPVQETLEIIEKWMEQIWVGWNVPFDAFHINKWYNILRCYKRKEENPDPDMCYQIEQTRPAEFCLRPRGCIDLMIICRKGPFQHLMNFKPIILRGVPIHRAEAITQEISARIDFTKVPGLKMHYIIEKEDRRPGLTNIKIVPKGSTSLKYVHKVIMGEPLDDETIHWGDLFPTKEFGKEYMPWGGYWADEVRSIKGFTRSQIEYGLADITKMHDIMMWLDDRGYPTSKKDIDSELCPLVGATRWKGYSIDKKKLEDNYPKRQIVDNPRSYFHQYGVPTSPKEVRKYLEEVMDDNEKLLLTATKKDVLRQIVSLGDESGKRAQEVLTERKNRHLRDMFKKLLEVGSFHPDLKVSGTLTNRMSGGNAEVGVGKQKGSINPQGIDKAKWIREGFTFAFIDEMTSGGDFKSFEISIMDAVWGDDKLHQELLTGKKMIALFGSRIYGLPYDEVLASDAEGEGSKYDRAKKGFYARAYGGQNMKLSQVFGLTLEETAVRTADFDNYYPGIGKANFEVVEKFTMLQEWDWREPDPYQETILGFRRSFVLEQEIARAMFKLVNDLPLEWLEDHTIFRRRDKPQETWQVIRSALFGCLLGLQARIIRVAGNLKIQSPGGEITKIVQERIWDIYQPIGVHPWVVRPMNVHDEIICVHKPEIAHEIGITVQDCVHQLKKHVPLLEIKWKEGMKSWAEK